MVEILIGSKKSPRAEKGSARREGTEHVERLLRRMAQLDRAQFEPSNSSENTANSENYWREKVLKRNSSK
jgi:hypothetical protein